MRYDKFDVIVHETGEVLYSSKTISAIKRYIKKHNIPIDMGSTGIAIKCHHHTNPLTCSLDKFYSKTYPSREIMQQEFSSEIRDFRKIVTVW